MIDLINQDTDQILDILDVKGYRFIRFGNGCVCDLCSSGPCWIESSGEQVKILFAEAPPQKRGDETWERPSK
jgi:hypothetical protein